MPNLYRSESSNPKRNAQLNLAGRNHDVDDDTLRYHKSRVIAATVVDRGLLFTIVTSDSLDYENTRRGFRYVIFDVFGTVVDPQNVESAFATSKQARKAMWQALDKIDAIKVTREGIERAERRHAIDMQELRAKIDKM